MNRWLEWMGRAPRRWFMVTGLTAVAMLLFGLYLQHVVGLEPCPMCIVQRYALLGVAVVSAFGAMSRGRGWQIFWALALAGKAGFGGFTAARQSWLQWYPPEVVSCGRDLYGMIENFPLQRVIPMVFKGSGDCSKVDWTFLGGSIANWSFLVFMGYVLLGLVLAWQLVRKP